MINFNSYLSAIYKKLKLKFSLYLYKGDQWNMELDVITNHDFSFLSKSRRYVEYLIQRYVKKLHFWMYSVYAMWSWITDVLS